MDRERAIAELREYLKDYLETKHGINTAKNFRCLNPQHEDKNPSMGFDAAHNQAHCFSCDASYDILDLIKQDYNCDFNEALKIGCETYHIPLDSNSSAGSSPIRKSATELERERKEREAKTKAEAEKAATAQKQRSAELKTEFEAAKLATDEHPYLQDKQVKTDGTLRVNQDNTLLLSAQDAEDNFRTFQRIFAAIPQDGERKKFAQGSGLKTGAFHVMGGQPLNDGDNVLLAEGYATAASIYECIGDKYRVIVGFDAGNLPYVTKAIKSKFPNIIIGIAADDDSAKHEDKNTGINAAVKCCRAGASWYIKPPFDMVDLKNGRTDWNDYYCAYEVEATREALFNAIANPITPVSVSVDVQADTQAESQTPNYSDEEIAQMAQFAAAQSNDTGDYDNLQPSEAELKEDKPQQGQKQTFSYIDGNSLLKKEFPPVKWAVEGFLPMGLSLLGGGPKVGKSILALHLSLAVALGGMALGKIPVERGSVLYLALEDTERRLKERILGSGIDADNVDLSKLGIFTEIPRQHEGGMDYLKNWLDKRSDARLVIIDTLQKFRRPRANKADWYAEDYSCMAEFKQLADDYSVPILIIHHLKKGEEKEDWINEFSGSQGLAGAADTLLNLKRGRNQNSGILKRTGRDVEEAEFAMTLNEFNWTLEGEAAYFDLSDKKKKIVDCLIEHGGQTPKEIANRLEMDAHNIRTELSRMANKGEITKTGALYFVNLSSNINQF